MLRDVIESIFSRIKKRKRLPTLRHQPNPSHRRPSKYYFYLINNLFLYRFRMNCSAVYLRINDFFFFASGTDESVLSMSLTARSVPRMRPALELIHMSRSCGFQLCESE